MSWSDDSMRQLRQQIMSLAQHMKMHNGMLRLNVNQSSLVRIDTRWIFKYYRVSDKTGWKLRTTLPATTLRHVPDDISLDLDDLVSAAVDGYGWVEAHVENGGMTGLLLYGRIVPKGLPEWPIAVG